MRATSRTAALSSIMSSASPRRSPQGCCVVNRGTHRTELPRLRSKSLSCTPTAWSTAASRQGSRMDRCRPCLCDHAALTDDPRRPRDRSRSGRRAPSRTRPRTGAESAHRRCARPWQGPGPSPADDSRDMRLAPSCTLWSADGVVGRSFSSACDGPPRESRSWRQCWRPAFERLSSGDGVELRLGLQARRSRGCTVSPRMR